MKLLQVLQQQPWRRRSRRFQPYGELASQRWHKSSYERILMAPKNISNSQVLPAVTNDFLFHHFFFLGWVIPSSRWNGSSGDNQRWLSWVYSFFQCTSISTSGGKELSMEDWMLLGRFVPWWVWRWSIVIRLGSYVNPLCSGSYLGRRNNKWKETTFLFPFPTYNFHQRLVFWNSIHQEVEAPWITFTTQQITPMPDVCFLLWDVVSCLYEIVTVILPKTVVESSCSWVY